MSDRAPRCSRREWWMHGARAVASGLLTLLVASLVSRAWRCGDRRGASACRACILLEACRLPRAQGAKHVRAL